MAEGGLFPSGWGPTQYILMAVAGTLAASLVIIVASVVFSPAHIVFSVTGASSSRKPSGDHELNFTLAADNPSHRAGVQYCSMTASLRVYSASNRVEWVQTEVLEAMPLLQPRASSRNIPVSGFFSSSYMVQNFGAVGADRLCRPPTSCKAPPMVVLVSAEVRFKVGPVYSRPYSVQVSCSPVDFFTAGNNAAAKRIGCVA